MNDLLNDIKLFSWDLQEYKNSIQGKKISKLLAKNISYNNKEYNKKLIDALDDYWYCRNCGGEFTYLSEKDKQDGISWDLELAKMYREQD